MKAFFLALSMIISRQIMAATYEVPMTTELKKFATFELEEFRVKNENQTLIIKYALPETVTGSVQTITLVGFVPESTQNFFMYGDKAEANCRIEYTRTQCSVVYKKLEIDLDKARAAIELISQSVEETQARLEVTRFFSNDPVGIITF